MSAIGHTIRNVLIYKGHANFHLTGPYVDSIPKQIALFETLNFYREKIGRAKWIVTTVLGEHLENALKTYIPKETLLVIPPGPSTQLDGAFSDSEIASLHDFLHTQGGRAFFTCGSSYMVSQIREYKGLKVEHSPKRFCGVERQKEETSIKESRLPLFEGIAKGPLCPHPEPPSFYVKAATVTDGKKNCNLYLSGGGSFVLSSETTQKVRVLLKYLPKELFAFGKTASEHHEFANAAILAQVGIGSALLTMPHVDYGPEDIDVAACNARFPFEKHGSNWQEIQNHLTPTEERLPFILEFLLIPLEDALFEG